MMTMMMTTTNEQVRDTKFPVRHPSSYWSYSYDLTGYVSGRCSDTIVEGSSEDK